MCATIPHSLKLLESWLKSYKPEELFDAERPPGPRASRARTRRARAA